MSRSALPQDSARLFDTNPRAYRAYVRETA